MAGAVAAVLSRMTTAQLRPRRRRHRTQPGVSFWSVFKTPAIYGIIIGTFAYNYFNYFCLTWLPAYFVEQWHMTKMEMGVFTAFSFTGMAVVAILAGMAGDRLIARGWDPIKVRKGFTIAGLAVASTEVIGVMSGSKEIALHVRDHLARGSGSDHRELLGTDTKSDAGSRHRPNHGCAELRFEHVGYRRAGRHRPPDCDDGQLRSADAGNPGHPCHRDRGLYIPGSAEVRSHRGETGHGLEYRRPLVQRTSVDELLLLPKPSDGSY